MRRAFQGVRRKLFCFGYGYTAEALAKILKPQGWKIVGTTTDPEKRDRMEAEGITAYLFDPTRPLPDTEEAFIGVTHMLFSIPPSEQGDPVYEAHGFDIASIRTLLWAGYLSTTGVYGDHGGNWIDEETPLAPTSRRGSLRQKAEEEWQSLAEFNDLPLHIFRLSGIYGPGRSVIESVQAGTAKRIDKPGHVFNRMHIDDIAATLAASIEKPKPGSIYNLADDMPAPSEELIAHACNLIGIEPPPLTPFSAAELAPMARSFYKDNKRVKNDKIKNELGVTLKFPDYKSGLEDCLRAAREAEA